jgi:hypothetical protein
MPSERTRPALPVIRILAITRIIFSKAAKQGNWKQVGIEFSWSYIALLLIPSVRTPASSWWNRPTATVGVAESRVAHAIAYFAQAGVSH